MLNRRKFVATASAGAWAWGQAADKPKNAHDVIELGPRKVKVSRLAMGTGTNGGGGSSNQTRLLGVEGLARLLRTAYDDGVFFFDSADQYGTHPYVKAALKDLPREKVTILSKTHASTAAEMKADLDRFRKELGTDYIDILLLHAMMDGDWNKRKRGAMDAIEEAQAKGIVRTKGCSCHTLDALKTALAEPWVEVDLARYNWAGTSAAMDADPPTVRAVLQQMKDAGKGIIGMKVFGAGKLRDKADESLAFVLGSGVIDCFTIGSESIEQYRDLTRKIPAASTRG
jgi:1-deoxyxylulose-5-phosphate synthase